MTVAQGKSYWTSTGRSVTLGRHLGRGGEANVFEARALAADGLAPQGRALAAKIYHRYDSMRARKLEAMIATVPTDATRAQGHVSLAWPEELVVDHEGHAMGFIMPLVDLRRSMPLHQLYHPKSRRHAAPGITWRYLVRIAHNLCAAVAALHARGYVLGDLNESNVLVGRNALITLVDCDSVQLRTEEGLFRCPVAKPEFTAPELQGRAVAGRALDPSHDVFALSTLVFMLLMEGTMPFASASDSSHEAPGIAQAIREGNSPYLKGAKSAVSPLAPPFALLPKPLRRMMQASLMRPSWLRGRPSAAEWRRALAALDARLVVCSERDSHVFARHLASCPWCARIAALGLDAYPPAPSLGRSAAFEAAPPACTDSLLGQRARPGATVGSRLAGLRSGWFHRTVPVLAATLILVIGAAAISSAPLFFQNLGADSRPPLQAAAAFGVGALVAAALSVAILSLAARTSATLSMALLALERFLRAVAAGVASGAVAALAYAGLVAAAPGSLDAAVVAVAAGTVAFVAVWRSCVRVTASTAEAC